MNGNDTPQQGVKHVSALGFGISLFYTREMQVNTLNLACSICFGRIPQRQLKLGLVSVWNVDLKEEKLFFKSQSRGTVIFTLQIHRRE